MKQYAEDGEGENDDSLPFLQQRKAAKSEPPRRIHKIDKKMPAEFYFYKHRFGCVNSDSEDEDYLPSVCGQSNHKLLELCDPETRHKIQKDIVRELAPKLSNTAIFFTLIKGFVGSGILFLPNGFSNAGWFFSIGALLLSMWMTLASILLLLKCSAVVQGSFSDIGKQALGKWGKYSCDVTLALSQTGMTCAGVAFICQNSKSLLFTLAGVDVSMFSLGILCFFILTPMVWVRRLQVYAQFHMAADIIIVFAI